MTDSSGRGSPGPGATLQREMSGSSRASARPRVVIVGGGFGGINAARELASAPVEVTLIDRCNYHLFQPLLYQVATATLSPADIASPIRKVLKRQANATVVLAEATAVDPGRRRVRTDLGDIPFDWLVLAAGATHSYFSNDAWATHAPGLKSIDDATEIRRRFLLAFESAELERDPEARRSQLTFVVVGAGPTGVELAGALSEIARETIPRDFRMVDTTTARIVLVEALDRVGSRASTTAGSRWATRGSPPATSSGQRASRRRRSATASASSSTGPAGSGSAPIWRSRATRRSS